MGILSYWIAIFKNATASLPFCTTKVLLFLPPDFCFLYSLVLCLPAAQSAAASGFVSFKKKNISVNVRGLPVLNFFSIVTGRNNMILKRIHEQENDLVR